MTESEIFDLLLTTKALVPMNQDMQNTAHFSSDEQCYQVRAVKAFQFPLHSRKLAYEVVRHFWEVDVQVVIAVSKGAILLATEISRQLEARVMYSIGSKTPETTVLEPFFEIHSGDRILFVEDVLTDNHDYIRTLSKEILRRDARLIGIASLIDNTSKSSPLNVRQVGVIRNIPLC